MDEFMGKIRKIAACNGQSVEALRAAVWKYFTSRGYRVRTVIEGEAVLYEYLPGDSPAEFALPDGRGRNIPKPDNEGQRKEAVTAYVNGEISLGECRARCGGVSREWIRQLLGKYGLAKKERQFVPADHFTEAELDAYRRGLAGRAAMAKRLGCGEYRAAALLRAAGVVRASTCKPVHYNRFVAPQADVEDYLHGRTNIDQLALKHVVSRGTVYNGLLRAGVSMTRRPGRDYIPLTLAPADVRRIQLWFVTPKTLATELGVSEGCVRQAMDRQGVHPLGPVDDLAELVELEKQARL